MIRRLLHLGLLVHLKVALCSLPSATLRGDTPATSQDVLFLPAGDKIKEDVSFWLPVVRIEKELDALRLITKNFSMMADVSAASVLAEAAGLVLSRSQNALDQFRKNYEIFSVKKEDVQTSPESRSKLPVREDKPTIATHQSAATIMRELRHTNINRKIKAGVEGIPGLKSSELKRNLYNLLETIEKQPDEAIRSLVMAEQVQDLSRHKDIRTHAGRLEEWLDDTRNLHFSLSEAQTSNEDHEDKSTPAGYSNIRELDMSLKTRVHSTGVLQNGRVRRQSKGVMYLPINQPRPDPCAAPKGSKLLKALPLVFLSSIMSVADAVGNVLNNINNNNRNNNNNNDNNVNSDNTNLAANINNANQINLVPIGGRVLRIARNVMNSVGTMALGIYEAVLPSAEVDDDPDAGTRDDEWMTS